VATIFLPLIRRGEVNGIGVELVGFPLRGVPGGVEILAFDAVDRIPELLDRIPEPVDRLEALEIEVPPGMHDLLGRRICAPLDRLWDPIRVWVIAARW
jgi:hypothetical protein